MSDWQLTALALVSWGALDLGFVVAFVLFHRHHAKQEAQRCHFCQLHPAHPESLWCSAVCADAEIGVLGKEATL